MIALLLLLQESFDVDSKAPEAETRELVRFLERARAAYLDILKPEEPRAKKLKIVVHADRAAYIRAGGSPISGANYDGKRLMGYWDPEWAKPFFAHELVHHLVDASSRFTFSYPEWFHEGFADALANIEIDEEVRIGALSGPITRLRLREIQKALADGTAFGLADLLTMGIRRFHERPTMAYAQAWSVCHFLLERHRARILNYYRLLRAGGTNHDKAWARAFEGVKIAELEKEWKDFVASLVYFPTRLAGRRYVLRTTAAPERGRELLDFMEAIAPEYESFFGVQGGRRTELLLFQSAEEYRRFGCPPNTEGCHREGTIAGIVHETLTKPVFAHEAVHRYLDLAGGGPYPPWFAEGLGEIFANHERAEGRHRFGTMSGVVARARLPIIRDAICRGREIPLAKLLELDRKSFDEQARTAYAQSWSLVQFLFAYPAAEDRLRTLPEGRHRPALADFTARLRKGTPAAKAWAAAFAAVSLEELELQWKLYVLTLEGARTLAIQAEETDAGLRITAVLPGGLGAEAGLRRGDLLVRFRGRTLAGGTAWAHLQEEVVRQPAREPAVLVLVRDGAEREIRIAWPR